MKKTVVFLLLAAMLVTSVLSGCVGEKAAKTGEGEKITLSVSYPNADETWANDDYYKYITDKIGIDIDFQSLSSDSAAQKARIMISSGTMTDVVYTTSFLFDEYKEYIDQGVVKALPDGWEKKYPNLGFAMSMTGVLDTLKEIGDGKVYTLLIPMDHYSFALEDFRQAYKEGKNLRAMMGENEYRYINKAGFAYRKDWAQQLGIKTDLIMEYEDFMDMARKFKEADLGNVGKNNVVGLAVDHTEAPNFFIKIFNPRYRYFYKDKTTGKYVCGLTEESTIEGVKAYAEAYREGILSKSFYTQKSNNLDSLFCSQRSGIIFPKAEVSALRTLSRNFEKANPGKLAQDCIDVCWVKSPDGTIAGSESHNYFGLYYINPDISDEKLEKILELADYVSSKEGGPQIRLGLPGVDYEKSGDEYTIIREKNEGGTYDDLKNKYPSYDFFRMFLNPCYSLTIDIDPYARECMNKLTEAKRAGVLNLYEWDDDLKSYTAEDYVKFNAAYEPNSMFAGVITLNGDVEKNWLKKRAEFEDDLNSVLKNMNKALTK